MRLTLGQVLLPQIETLKFLSDSSQKQLKMCREYLGKLEINLFIDILA